MAYPHLAFSVDSSDSELYASSNTHSSDKRSLDGGVSLEGSVAGTSQSGSTLSGYTGITDSDDTVSHDSYPLDARNSSYSGESFFASRLREPIHTLNMPRMHSRDESYGGYYVPGFSSDHAPESQMPTVQDLREYRRRRANARNHSSTQSPLCTQQSFQNTAPNATACGYNVCAQDPSYTSGQQFFPALQLPEEAVQHSCFYSRNGGDIESFESKTYEIEGALITYKTSYSYKTSYGYEETDATSDQDSNPEASDHLPPTQYQWGY